jgi:predicted RecB family nuclease
VPSPTDLANLARCAHRVYLDAAGDPAEKLPASSFLELLWESGLLHEDRIVASLGAVDARVSDDKTARIAETRRLMVEETPLIYHAYFQKGDLRGEPDLIEKVGRPSTLGAFAYIPTDIKASSVFGKGKNPQPKEKFLLQLSAYAELLEDAQGWWPDTGKIIDAQGTANVLDLASYRSTYEENRRRLARIRGGEEKTVPGWKGECVNCQWQAVCVRALEETDDVTLVGGIGESYRAKLATIGVRTAADLATADPGALRQLKGIGESFSTAWVRQAKAQKRGTPEILGLWVPPDVDFEISYDIEDFTPDPFLYLHGLLIREKGARKFGDEGFTEADWGRFEPLCATLPDETEEALWRRFLVTIAGFEKRGNYAVYVYSHHEKTNLEKLAMKYGGSIELDYFIGWFVDLLPVVKRCVVFPKDSTGLKALARFVGFDWRDEDPGGSQSMAWWAEYVGDPVGKKALRERVIAYNEDDVRATFALKDWLERNLRS